MLLKLGGRRQHLLLTRTDFTTGNTTYSNGNNDWYATLDDGSKIVGTRPGDLVFLRAENLSGRFPNHTPTTKTCGDLSDSLNLKVFMGPYQREMVYEFTKAWFSDPAKGSCSTSLQAGGEAGFKTFEYTAELHNDNANEVRLPATEAKAISINGQLRNYAFRAIRSSDSGLPVDASGVSFIIEDGSSYFTQNDRFTATTTDTYTSGELWFRQTHNQSYDNPGDIQWHIKSLPTSLGIHACSDVFRISTGLGAIYDATEYISNAHQLKTGAACEIQVTQAGSGWIKGTFSATLISNMPTTLHPKAQDNSIQISGSFQQQLN